MASAANTKAMENTEQIRTQLGNTYGAITACNISYLHCGPAISLPVFFHSLTDSDFGYHLDAAVAIPDTKEVYLFQGKYYRVFDLESRSPKGPVKDLGGYWTGIEGTVFAKGVDSALSDINRKLIYLVKGNDIIQCSLYNETCGSVKKIFDVWPALKDSEFANHIDSAVNIPGTNKSYLFWNGYYRLFNLDTGKPESGSLTISNHWKGLDGTTFAQKIRAALSDENSGQILLYSDIAVPGKIPSGGWGACSGQQCGTIGMAWADDNGNLVGHLTVAHLGAGINSFVTSTAWDKIPRKNLTVIRTTTQGDVKLIEPVDDSAVIPTLILPDKSDLVISGWAHAGEIHIGDNVCHGGTSANTQKNGGVGCGIVFSVGDTNDCHIEGNYSSCAVIFRSTDTTFCSPGDSGAAVWKTNSDGTVRVVGTVSSAVGSICTFEPTYASSQFFSGQPFITSAPPPKPEYSQLVSQFKSDALNKSRCMSSEGIEDNIKLNTCEGQGTDYTSFRQWKFESENTGYYLIVNKFKVDQGNSGQCLRVFATGDDVHTGKCVGEGGASDYDSMRLWQISDDGYGNLLLKNKYKGDAGNDNRCLRIFSSGETLKMGTCTGKDGEPDYDSMRRWKYAGKLHPLLR